MRAVALITVFLLSAFLALSTNAAGSSFSTPGPAPTPTATAIIPLPAPSALIMTARASTKFIPAGAWIAATQLSLRFQVHVNDVPLTPQVEIQRISVPFTGQPNFFGRPLASSGQAIVPVSSLSNGQRYHWRARVVDASGLASDWVPFRGPGMAVGVDLMSPSRPVINSPTDPDQNAWYNTRTVTLRWTSFDPLSGIQGYSFVLLRGTPHVIPPGSITARTSIRLTTLSDGIWFLAVRSVNRAGIWSPTATFRLQLDRTAPRVTWLSPTRVTYNPYQGPISLRFRVDKPASVRLALYRVGSNQPAAVYSFPRVAANVATTVVWSGRDAHGKPAREGYYFYAATATDHAHNIVRADLGGIDVNPQQPLRAVTGQMLYPNGGKEIIVSLARQTLYAYDGTHLDLQTLVTTGNPSLPTPLGSYSILAKYSPFTFISPWPLGSPFWYPPSPVQYAMLFQSEGYFLHDAPWRSAFGPGTNGPGQPGTNYGGSHGCVNIPPDPMTYLWNWTPMGTPVDVVP